MDGCKAVLLDVDLTAQKISPMEIDEETVKLFIGGRGLGVKLLWDQQKPGLNPLDPEALLMFLIGPLTGLAPGGAHTTVVFKSPGTEQTIGHAVTGGQWGPELRYAGYSGIIVRGAAPKPVYLYVSDSQSEIRDAGHLWGLDVFAAETAIRQEVADEGCRILSIGPAGEKLIPFASIQQERFRSAARGGGGSVMGSKNLKAIVVRGHRSVCVSNPGTFQSQWRQMCGDLVKARNTRRGYNLQRWGSTMGILPHSDVSELDVKNYREGYWDKSDTLGGLAYENECKIKNRSCFGCPLGCMQLGVIRRGQFKGTMVNPDFDPAAVIGSGCLVQDINDMAYLTNWVDAYGFDGCSLGNITSFCMECYERGILDDQSLDGIRLTWGNVEAMLQLWRLILERKGIGEVLARGVRHAAAALGQGTAQFAMHVKGLEFAGYTPQAHPDRALQYAVGDRGGCHHYGLNMIEQDHRAWADSLCVCSWHRPFVKPAHYLAMLNAVTGASYRLDDWDIVANRILTLSRAYNIREGIVPLQDDVLPERVHQDALTAGSHQGAFYPLDQFEKDRKEWYLRRGYDANGVPTLDTLKKLNLEFVWDSLAKSLT